MWHTVSLLFEGVHLGQDAALNLWEERLVLIRSASEVEAARRATAWAAREEVAYPTAAEDSVHWVFRKVERVCPVESDQLGDGVELFSRFLKAGEVQSLAARFAETP